MKLITKKQLFNVRTIIAVLAMPMIMIVSFLIQSSWVDLMFFDDFSDIPADEISAAKDMLINQLLDWDMYHIHSNMYTPLFYPLFATLPVIFASYENNGYLQYIFVRKASYKKTIISKCMKYALISGFVMMTGYWIFIIFGAVIGLRNPEYDCGMLMDFFPDLMKNFPVLGGMIHGFTVYFVFGFAFGLFAAAISINTEKSFLIILIPHIYYLLVGNILSAIHNMTDIFLFQQFSPWYPVTVTGENYSEWYSVYFSLIPVFIVSIILIIRRLRNEIKITN